MYYTNVVLDNNFYSFITKKQSYPFQQRYPFLTRSMGNLNVSSSRESRCIEKRGTGSIVELFDRTNGAIVERVISGDATAEGNVARRGQDGESPAATNLFGVFNECGVRGSRQWG